MPGGAAFTLTVTGTNFASGATVNWNGTILTPTVVTPTQLTVTVPASAIASAGSESVSVTSGGVTSNTVSFTVSVHLREYIYLNGRVVAIETN
jgi:uncharacterized protein (TIGR03437 family)